MEIIEREYTKSKKKFEKGEEGGYIEREFEEECKIKRKQLFGEFQVSFNSNNHIVLRSFVKDNEGHIRKELLICLTAYETMKLLGFKAPKGM